MLVRSRKFCCLVLLACLLPRENVTAQDNPFDEYPPPGKPVMPQAEKRPVVEVLPEEEDAPRVPANLSTTERIEWSLKSPSRVVVKEKTPFTVVRPVLEQTYGIAVAVDVLALKDLGLDADSFEVWCPHRGIRLESALRHMLREHELTWMVHDETLIITTPEKAEETLEVRVYTVTDLLLGENATEETYPDFDSLIEILHTTIAPTSWDYVGGPGSIQPVIIGGSCLLVVSQTWSEQNEVNSLLEQLRRAVADDEHSLKVPPQPALSEQDPTRSTNFGVVAPPAAF